MDDPNFHPLTYAHMVEQYIRHPEAKSLGPDGNPCTAETRGLLQRAHVTAGRICYIDKETFSMWAQGDDLSVVTDSDETGFRVVEYGKAGKMCSPFPRSVKSGKLDHGNYAGEELDSTLLKKRCTSMCASIYTGKLWPQLRKPRRPLFLIFVTRSTPS